MFRRSHARRQESGASAVELALLLPFLTVLIFGLLQYGFYFYAKQSAVAAVREGARRTSVGDLATCGNNPSTSTKPAAGTFRRYVYDNVDNAASGQGAPTFTITRSFVDPVSGSARTPAQAGDIMTVKVTFKALDLGLVPLPGGTITATTQSRVDNVNSAAPVACP